MTKARLCVPIPPPGVDPNSVNPRQTAESIRAALNQIKSTQRSVDVVKKALADKRKKRLDTLLQGKRVENGFLKSQLAVIATAGVNKSLVGTLPYPIQESSVESEDISNLYNAKINKLRFTQTFGYILRGTPNVSDIVSMTEGTVVSMSEEPSFTNNCPVNNTFNRVDSPKMSAERNSKEECKYGRFVKVEYARVKSSPIRIVYGMLTTIAVSVGQVLKKGDRVGTGSVSVFDGFMVKNGNESRIPNFLYYLEPPKSLTTDLQASNQEETYQTNSSYPYGKFWGGTRPPGLPEGVRNVSAPGIGVSRVEDLARSINDDEDFYTICRLLHNHLTQGGFLAHPSDNFDSRASQEEVEAGINTIDPPEAFIDSGPFPRGEGDTLITSPYRP